MDVTYAEKHGMKKSFSNVSSCRSAEVEKKDELSHDVSSSEVETSKSFAQCESRIWRREKNNKQVGKIPTVENKRGTPRPRSEKKNPSPLTMSSKLCYLLEYGRSRHIILVKINLSK